MRIKLQSYCIAIRFDVRLQYRYIPQIREVYHNPPKHSHTHKLLRKVGNMQLFSVLLFKILRE